MSTLFVNVPFWDTRHIYNNIPFPYRFLSNQSHIAGSEENLKLGRHLMSFWKDHGIDHVTLTPYNVLLSYPNMSDLNYVELLDENGTQVYKSNLTEPFLTPEEDKAGVVPPFNAFSAQGDIKVIPAMYTIHKSHAISNPILGENKTNYNNLSSSYVA